MKLLSLLLCLGGFCVMTPSHAQDELPSFEQVRSHYFKSKDLTRVSYLYRRCAALELNAAALLVRQKHAKGASDYENLARHYMLMSEAVDREIDLHEGLKSAKPTETVSLAVKYLSEIYGKRMQHNKATHGDFFAHDSMLKKEMAECLNPESLAKSLGR